MPQARRLAGRTLSLALALLGQSSLSQAQGVPQPAPLAPAPAPGAATPAPPPAPPPTAAPGAAAPAPPVPAPAPSAPTPVQPPAPSAEPVPQPAPVESSEVPPTDTTVTAEGSTSLEAGGSLVPPPVEPIRLIDDQPVSAPAEAEPKWYESIEAAAFIDAYFSLNAGLPKPQSGKNRFRAYDTNNGFSLSWVGLNLSYQKPKGGGTLDLRFGPTAERSTGEPDTSAGLHMVKQAYATWRPGEVVSLDFGKFNTIYGAEAVESQLNYNYTRGLLNWLAQPVFHTGLRANIDISPQFWITALLVNGWNNSVDNNLGKSFGIQFSTAIENATQPESAPLFDAHLGYLVGPEGQDYAIARNLCADPNLTFNPLTRGCDDTFAPAADAQGNTNSDVASDAGDGNTVGLRHLIDLVVGLNPSDTFSMLFNFDYGFENTREGSLDVTAGPGTSALPGFSGQSFWGLAAMGRLQLNDEWAGALRGEVYSDPDGRASADGDLYINSQPDVMLYSATLTAEVVPEDGLIFRLDNRLDLANTELFPSRLRSYGTTQFTSTLGVVVSME